MAESVVIGPVAAPGLQVMSYNIRRRMSQLFARSPDRWVHRRPLLKRFLEDEQPALLGAQEALPQQANFVRHALGEHYRSIGYGREANRRGEATPIFYDSHRLRLLDWQQTALSDTPNAPGSTSWGNHTPRMVVEAIFLDLATGIQFQSVNTHLDNFSHTARLRSAEVLRRIVSDSALPSIVTGDFNTNAGTSPYTALTGHGLLVDAWNTADLHRSDAWGTFLNYRSPKLERKRIDWILVSPSVRVLSAAINVTRYKGGWPSDHAAVQAVLNLSDAAVVPSLEP